MNEASQPRKCIRKKIAWLQTIIVGQSIFARSISWPIFFLQVNSSSRRLLSYLVDYFRNNCEIELNTNDSNGSYIFIPTLVVTKYHTYHWRVKVPLHHEVCPAHSSQHRTHCLYLSCTSGGVANASPWGLVVRPGISEDCWLQTPPLSGPSSHWGWILETKLNMLCMKYLCFSRETRETVSQL